MAPRDVQAELLALLPRLRRFARSLTRNVHDADDLVQLAIERALGRLAQLKPEAQLAPWMYGIVRHAWIDELRARGRRGELAAAGLPEPAVHPPAAESLAVEDALARLPEEQRMAVALVLIEGLSYKEAAHVSQVPIGTLTSRLARARTALQALLGEEPVP